MMFWDKRMGIIALFALLAVAAVASAASIQPGTGTSSASGTGNIQRLIDNANKTFSDALYGGNADWLRIAFAVLLITFMLTTVVYVIGYGFNLEEAKRWAKMEYMQIVATLLLFGFIVVGMAVGWVVINEVISGPQGLAQISFLKEINTQMQKEGWDKLAGDPFAVSELYIRNVVNCEKKAYARLYAAGMFLEPLEKHSIEIAGAGDPVHGWYLTGIINLIHSAQTNLTYGLMMGYFQIELLRFIEVSMLMVFLPAGLVLRTFPITRGAGGLLIAIALGFFFVFPVSYIITLAGADYGSFCKVADTAIPDELKETSCYTSPADITFQKGQENKAVGWANNLVSELHNTLFIILIGVFSMLYALIITVTFVRATSYVFGSDLAEIGRGLIKLI